MYSQLNLLGVCDACEASVEVPRGGGEEQEEGRVEEERAGG